jgi:hypothetical protein
MRQRGVSLGRQRSPLETGVAAARDSGFEQAIQAIRSAATALWSFCDALFDGFAAFRQFEHQKSWSVAHDAALRQACCNQA